MNRKMTRLARGLWWGALGARGLEAAGAREARAEKASEPKPQAAAWSAERRVISGCMAGGLWVSVGGVLIEHIAAGGGIGRFMPGRGREQVGLDSPRASAIRRGHEQAVAVQ